MRHGGVLVCLLGLGLLPAAPAALAAPGAQNNPSIRIVSPQNGSTVTSSTVTVRVAVSHFRLVPPVFVNPPTLQGVQGHIQYVLDNQSNFVATRDATVSLTHTFMNVSPGTHTLIAYLATSRFARYDSVPEARVTITVEPAGGAQPAPTAPPAPTAQPKPTAATMPGVGRGPRTGGGGIGNRGMPNLSALLAGLCALVAGFWLRRRGRPSRRDAGGRTGAEPTELPVLVEVGPREAVVDPTEAAPAGTLVQERVLTHENPPPHGITGSRRAGSWVWIAVPLGILLAVLWRRR